METTAQKRSPSQSKNQLKVGTLANHSGTLKSTFELFFTVKMTQFNGLNVISGIVIAFYSGFLVKLISNAIDGSDNEKLTKSLYWMIVFGWGEVIAGYLYGKLLDYIGNRLGVLLSMVIVLATIGLTLYTHSRK